MDMWQEREDKPLTHLRPNSGMGDGGWGMGEEGGGGGGGTEKQKGGI